MVKVSVNYDLQELCILHCNILSSDIRHSARGIAREILVCDGKISLEAVAAIEQKTRPWCLIISILIFSKISSSILIFSKISLSILIFSKIFLSISIFLASQNALEVIMSVSQSLTLFNELTYVTLVSEDTYWGLYCCITLAIARFPTDVSGATWWLNLYLIQAEVNISPQN